MASLGIAACMCLPVSFSYAQQSTQFVETPITLTAHFHFRNSKVYKSDWPVELKASQLTGISLKNVALEYLKDSTAAFNLMIANGDLPDIVGGNGLQMKFNQYGPEGVFVPLDALIEEHAPNIKAFFKKRPELRQAITAADGKMYFIPYVPDGKYGRAYFIRTDWLNKLELGVPENVEQLYQVLKAFKMQDPNGNGLEDEIPFFVRDPEELIRLVTLWDARTSGSDTWHDFYVENGEIKHGYILDEYRNGIEHLAKWFKEGLLDPEFYTRGSSARNELLGSDRGGMTHDWIASTATFNDTLADSIQGFEFKPLAPPASISGRRLAEHRRSQVKPDGWAITRSNKKTIETIKYFDFWFSETGKRLANFGIEGQHYTMIDGKPVFKDEILKSKTPVNAILWDAGAQIPRGFPQDYNYEVQWTNKIALKGIALYDQGDYLLEPFLGVTFNSEEKKIYDLYWDSSRQFMLERQEDWVLGTRDVNEDWDSYLVQLEKLGFNQVLQIMQSAYERQYRTEVIADSQ